MTRPAGFLSPGLLLLSVVAAWLALTAALAPAPAKAYLAIVRQGVESTEVPNATDHFGAAVATGDFDGDGYEDLATSAPDESNGLDGGDDGVVVVSYGGPRGITHVGASLLSVGDLADFQVNYGHALAAGDFNGDGVDDLAVGIPGMDFLASADIGSVWVYAGMPGVGINLAPYRQIHQADVAGAANEAGDQFGCSLAAGDVNLDGYGDLAVGAIGEDGDSGIVFYFPGSAAGVTATGSGFARQSNLGAADEPGSLFGFSLAIGDFYDSAHRDIAIGAPRCDPATAFPDGGRVYIVRGTAVGPVTAGSLMRDALTLNVGPQNGALFGWSLASGRLFAETGRDDLAIGEPLHDAPGATATGRVVVLEFAGNGEPVAAPVLLTQATDGDVEQPAAQFGWALTAGRMLLPLGTAGDDGYDDLAVGAPGAAAQDPGAAEAVLWAGAGKVYIYPGSAAGPVATGAKRLDAFQLNDQWYGFDEHLGWSLAFGAFDDYGFDNLAIGCPNKSYPAYIEPDDALPEAGQVYVHAFWRQPSGRPHRGSLVYDCGSRIVYAQRFRQRLTPASTTKAMTALIACEAIQNQDVDPAQLFTVPAWAANNVTGSQYGLFPGERISFLDLVRTMIAVSGNDCAYTIGDILTGSDNAWDDNQDTAWNLEHILTDFAAIMNARAAQLGLSPAHHFNNPAGRPYGEHWTTPEDMAIFVREAMDNDLFRDIVGTSNWVVNRQIPFSLLFPWLPPAPGLVPVVDNVGNGYFTAIASVFPAAAGVKGGWNQQSQTTGLYSGQLDAGRVTTAVFGIPPYGSLVNLGKELMGLVDSDCNPAPQRVPGGPTPEPFPVARFACVSTAAGGTWSGAAAIGEPNDEDLLIDVLRCGADWAQTSLALLVRRTTEFTLAPGTTRHFGVDRHERCAGFRLQYDPAGGGPAARLRVTRSDPTLTQLVTLQPGQFFELGATDASSPGAPLDIAVENLSSVDTVTLGLEEKGYGYDVVIGDRPHPDRWVVSLVRDGAFMADNIGVFVHGTDEEGGGHVDVSVHAAGVSTPVPDGPDGPPANDTTTLRLTSHPNPFNPATTVRFEIPTAGRVRLDVYDARGRRIRCLLDADYPAGTREAVWDGRDQWGRAMASGAYFARLEACGIAATVRMGLVR